MAEEELQVIRLRNDFYRDGFGKMLFALGTLITAVVLLIATSVYFFVAKPPPVTFTTEDGWRILPAVPINVPYLSDANVSQWLSETLSTIFDFDFLNYDTKRLSFEPYFTEDGWKKYNELLNTFFPANGIQTSKAVLSGSAYGGPVILNQGPLSTKKYAWWIQMPIRITFSGYNRNFKQIFVLQALIVRIPTVDNLSGVAIDNLIVVSQRQDNTGMLNQ